MADIDAILFLVAILVGIVVLIFNVYLWILAVRLLRLSCKFLKAQLDYYHSDCGN